MKHTSLATSVVLLLSPVWAAEQGSVSIGEAVKLRHEQVIIEPQI